MSQLETKFINPEAATDAKLAAMPAKTIKGNSAVTPEVPANLTIAQLRALIAEEIEAVSYNGATPDNNPTAILTNLSWGGNGNSTLPGWNGATGVFTATKAGWYRYDIRLLADEAASNNAMIVNPRVNGGIIDNILPTTATNSNDNDRTGICSSGLILLAVNDTLEFQVAILTGAGTWTPSCSAFALQYESA